MYRGDPSLAEDAYQTAFVKYIGIFREGPKPGIKYEPYFIVIAKNCLIDEIRRMKRNIPIDEVFYDEANQPETATTQDLDAKLFVLQGMMLLGRRCQFLLEGYYIAETPVPQLAKILRISPNSVYMTVKRCREELRRILSAHVRK